MSSGVSRQAWSGERATLAGTACTDHPNPSNVLQPYLYKLSISPEYTRSCFFLSFALRCASPALLGSLPAASPAPPAPAVEAVEAVEYDMDACCKKLIKCAGTAAPAEEVVVPTSNQLGTRCARDVCVYPAQIEWYNIIILCFF